MGGGGGEGREAGLGHILTGCDTGRSNANP